MALSKDKKEEWRKCQWELQDQFENQTNMEIACELFYTVGIKTTEENKGYHERIAAHNFGLGLGLDAKLAKATIKSTVSVRAGFTFRTENKEIESHLDGKELTESIQEKIHIVVKPKTKVFVWQPVCPINNLKTVGFRAHCVTESPNPPHDEVLCMFATLSEIKDETVVRLKNKTHNRYLNTFGTGDDTKAVLGDSQEFLFNIVRDDKDKKYVRIQIAGSNISAYSSRRAEGYIYFKEKEDDDSQLWEISNHKPSDGDAVTFRSKKWPGAGIVFCDKDGTNVHCLNANNLDLWILEVVDSPSFPLPN